MVKAEPPTLRGLVSAYVVEQVTVIVEAPAQLRAHEPVIHPTRVAVRRLRSTLRVFPDLFDDAAAAPLESELVWWAGLLGEVRDLDILEKRLTEAVAALPPELVVGPISSALQREIGLRRKAAWTEVETALDGDRYRALSAVLHGWRADIPFTPAADRRGKAVERYVERADKKVEKRLAAAGKAYAAGDPEADHLAHAARKAGKRHRYAAELAEPLWGKKARKVVSHRKDLQDVLGNHQDAVVSEAFLRDFGIRVGARRDHNGFTYGVLFAQERAELARLPEQLAPFLA
ncbi:CHAD domain-containing protein [Microlunatus ginsengisoli]|uniref:CHAD domain-containing protein n=1 Tax=Microlunatus ginsengisoli TaxID=363863 RepID=A0ABP6ZJP9_9ACTN